MLKQLPTMIVIFNRSTTFRRHYSGLYPDRRDPYEVLLKASISSIFNEDEWLRRGLLPFRKDQLITVLFREKNYPLSEINLFIIKESVIPPFLYQQILLESDRGYLGLEPWIEENTQVGVVVYQLSSPEDQLLQLSLSQVFYRTLIQGLPTPVRRYYDLKEHHYAFMHQQEKVCKLYKIDLTPSIKHIEKQRLLQSLQYIKNIPIVYELIKGFIEIPIYDNDNGLPFKCRGLPPMGEISTIIYHVFYTHVFDRILEKMYPRITYTRWGHQVFIAIKDSNRFLSDDLDVHLLLEKLDLAGNIESLDSKGGYLVSFEEDRVLTLYEDGDVEVFRTEDFI